MKEQRSRECAKCDGPKDGRGDARGEAWDSLRKHYPLQFGNGDDVDGERPGAAERLEQHDRERAVAVRDQDRGQAVSGHPKGEPAGKTVSAHQPIDNGRNEQAARAEPGEELAVAGVAQFQSHRRKLGEQNRVGAVDETREGNDGDENVYAHTCAGLRRCGGHVSVDPCGARTNRSRRSKPPANYRGGSDESRQRQDLDVRTDHQQERSADSGAGQEHELVGGRLPRGDMRKVAAHSDRRYESRRRRYLPARCNADDGGQHDRDPRGSVQHHRGRHGHHRDRAHHIGPDQHIARREPLENWLRERTCGYPWQVSSRSSGRYPGRRMGCVVDVDHKRHAVCPVGQSGQREGEIKPEPTKANCQRLSAQV